MDTRIQYPVLLVEDNPGDVDLVRDALRHIAHVQHVARLADAARQAPWLEVAAVVLDLALPDAAGIEGLERLRPLIPDVPIIVLTNSEDSELIARAAREGADDFLTKREVAGLPRAIVYAIERRRRLGESSCAYPPRARPCSPALKGVKASVEVAPDASPRHRVLLVEDNPGDADLVRAFLQDTDVVHVARLIDAERELAEHSPDVILLDLSLPDSTGLEGLERLRPQVHTIPIIVLTGGNNDSSLGTLAMQNGAEDYLTKGDIRVLPRVVSYAIERRKNRERETTAALAELARREAEEANRSKDRFLALLSHELRNPLAAICFAVDVLGRPAPDAQVHAREVLKRQVRQLTRLVDDLFDVAHIARNKLSVKLEPVALASVLRNALEAADPLITQHGHRVCARNVPESVLVEADAARLTQVLTNLLHNAAKFTPGGDKDIRVEAVAEATHAVITVRDPGIGFDAAKAERLFDMFHQEADPTHAAGLGLGLALAKQIVELHGGTIQALSDGPGRGAEFSVRLPVAHASPAIAKTATLRESKPSTDFNENGLRVLIVDDNVDAATLLQVLVAGFGHSTRIAHDGRAALALAAGFAPHVAILDIGLPGMNGYELAERLRAGAGGAQMHLVALTGWGEASDRLRALQAGFDLHLTKPTEPGALAQILEARKQSLRLSPGRTLS